MVGMLPKIVVIFYKKIDYISSLKSLNEVMNRTITA